MELAIVTVVLITIGAIVGSYLTNGFVNVILFIICFTIAGIFGGSAFLHWFADTPAADERFVPTLISIFFVCLCVLIVILSGG